MNMPRYTIATINLINVEVKKPKNEPKAALMAVLELLLLSSSPTKAPKKGPMRIPPGMGAISPMIKPTVVPIIPYFDPPNFLVPIAGMK